MRLWTDASRWHYNQAVELLTSDEAPKAVFYAIAKRIVGGPDVPARFKPVPYQVKRIAVRDACRAMSAVKKFNKELAAAKRRGKRLEEDFTDLNFRSRKAPTQSVFIPASVIKPSGIYPRILGRMRYSEPMPDTIKDSRLVVHGGRYYVTITSESPGRATETQGRVVALDPGVRTFQTFFSEMDAGKLGEGDYGRLTRLAHRLDDLISRTAKEPDRRKRRRMRRAANRMRWRVKDLVSELRHQAARFLVDRYDVILLPTFSASKMTGRAHRRIRAKSVRSLLTFRHYEFGKFLEHKAFEAGKLVLRVNEAYTSRVASWTGELKNCVGKRIRSDGVTLDRDINGARGIFLRALGDTPSLRAATATGAVSVC